MTKFSLHDKTLFACLMMSTVLLFSLIQENIANQETVKTNGRAALNAPNKAQHFSDSPLEDVSEQRTISKNLELKLRRQGIIPQDARYWEALD